MHYILRNIWRLFNKHEQRNAIKLVLLVLLGALLDVVGIASVIPFLTLLANPSAIQSNQILANIYAYLGYQDSNAFLLFLGWVSLGLILFSSAFQAWAQYATIRFAEMRRYSLGMHLMRSYLSQRYSFFLGTNSTDLAKNLLTEVELIVSRCIAPLIILFTDCIYTAIVLIFIVTIQPALALSAFLFLGGSFAVLYFLLAGRLRVLGKMRMDLNKERFAVVSEIFSGIKDVKLHQLESSTLVNYEQMIQRYVNCFSASQCIASLPRYAIQAMLFAGMMILLICLLALGKQLDSILPIIGLLAMAGIRLLPKMQGIYNSLSNLQFGAAVLEDMGKHLNMPQEDQFATEAVEPMQMQKEIALCNATFYYPQSSVPAVQNLSLTVTANSSVGIVGASGAGKTTTIDLILALYSLDSGELRIDGQTITETNRRAWQRSIGYVSQDIFLLDATIRDNITFGVPPEKIDEKAVVRAAKQANLHNFIIRELPEGYDTRIGERGVRLSGGQRQRIGIARAMYHNPSVLVFDEATSAVDNETEREIIKAMEHLGGQKTIIMIAHRLDTVRNCDCIYYMESGRVIASGTFEELARNEPRFQAMLGMNKP